jgi:PPM family protein phosphatase
LNNNFITLQGKSHIGNTRLENQDRYLAKNLQGNMAVLAVADGMGGVAAGGLAADMAIEFLEKEINASCLDPAALARLSQQAGDRIIAMASTDEKLFGMGTTLTVVLVEDRLAVWSHVGDSRLWLLRKGRMEQITRDHRFLQDLIDAGDLTPEAALRHPLRSHLDQCVGSPDTQPDCGSFSLERGDLLLLTTDGLHDYVRPERMAAVLDSSRNFPESMDMLISEAMNRGSTDNVCIVLGRLNQS